MKIVLWDMMPHSGGEFPSELHDGVRVVLTFRDWSSLSISKRNTNMEASY